MKNIIFLLLIFCGTTLAAQTKKKPTGSKTKTAAASPFKDSDLVGKEWKLKSWELFGIVKAPGENNKNDMLQLNSDGTFKLISNNTPRSGTWKRAGVYLQFTQPESTEKLAYKILSVERNSLKVDWREEESLHNTLEFESR
ncbi:MAG: hypothetical protein ACJ76F_06215 [Bacteroidia bacterium]